MAVVTAARTAHAKSSRPSGALPFFDPKSGKVKTYAGVKVKTFELTKAMQGMTDVTNAAYGGTYGAAALVKPSELARILKSSQKTGELMAGIAGYLDEGGTLDERKLTALSRGKLLPDIYQLNAKTSSLADWPQADRTEFEKALRPVVASMLSSPSARVFHLTGMANDDWGTDIYMAADPKTGQVKIFVQDGDA